MEKRIIKILVFVASVTLMIPILAFIFFFWNHTFSKDIADWASFGGYFGGVVSTLISLMSLAILGYITIWVSKQGNAENRNLFLNKKRLDAYTQFTSLLPKFQKDVIHGLEDIVRLEKDLDQNSGISAGNYPNIDIGYESATELFYYIVHFDSVHALLFKYDFKSEEFKRFIKDGDSIMKLFKHHKKIIHGQEHPNQKYSNDVNFNEFILGLNRFSKKLLEDISF